MIEFDPPERIYGVDFSAAKSDAGRNTWIAECAPGEDELVVERLADVAAFLACDPGRASMLPMLVDRIEGDPAKRGAFGLDFPFGLPSDLQGSDWHEFVSGIRERGEWGELGVIDGPRSLYDRAMAQGEESDVILRRVTDEDRGGQEPSGFRIRTQTYYGISGLLAELPDDVSVLPMDDPMTDTLVLETYPAATFRELGERTHDEVFDTGYKRDTLESIERRRTNVRVLSDAGVEFDCHHEFAIASDDALDAVAAAYAAWRATRDGTLPDDVIDGDGDVASPYDVEGYIFA